MAESKLSTHTRYTRRNLLVVSFMVTIALISGNINCGVKLPFLINANLSSVQVELIAFFTLLYLTISFDYYFEYDIRNNDLSEALQKFKQEETEKKNEAIKKCSHALTEWLQKNIIPWDGDDNITTFSETFVEHYIDARMPFLKNASNMEEISSHSQFIQTMRYVNINSLLSTNTTQNSTTLPTLLTKKHKIIQQILDDILTNKRFHSSKRFTDDYKKFDKKYSMFEKAPLYYGSCNILGLIGFIVYDLGILTAFKGLPNGKWPL